jgi:hypothetical protein
VERTPARWRPELRRELTLLVALKVLALALLWWLFFSPTHRPRVDAHAASERLGVAYSKAVSGASGGGTDAGPAAAAHTRCPGHEECR